MDDPESTAFKRAMMAGLTMECPYHGGNPEDCPLHEIRLMPRQERVQWVAQLSDETCLNIYQQHLFCLDSWRSHGRDGTQP